MRNRWVYVKGEAILADEYVPTLPDAPMVMGDIAPYTSMVDGRLITSRSKHREHLREHGMREVDPSEVAPEKLANYRHEIPDVAPQQRKELIRAQFDAMSQKDFKAALQRDIDRVKWQSNY